MEKTILNHHAGTVLAVCDSTKEFLLGQYDAGYPGRNKHWIGRVKFLGGNYFFGKDNDKSPLETYSREVSEEFSGKQASAEEMSALQEHKFASLAEVEFVRAALLSVEPFQDYFLHYKDSKDNSPVYVIQSVFKASISKEVMDVVNHNSSEGKSLTNEGFLAIKTKDELVKGNPMAQGITGLVIGQTERCVLPYCFNDLFLFAPIGKVRDSYQDYLDFFQYRDHSKKLNLHF